MLVVSVGPLLGVVLSSGKGVSSKSVLQQDWGAPVLGFGQLSSLSTNSVSPPLMHLTVVWCVPQRLCVENLVPDATPLGGGASGEVIGSLGSAFRSASVW